MINSAGMEESHSGLGFQFTPVVVADPRFAPRGQEFTNTFQENVDRAQRNGWEDFRDGEDYLGGEESAPIATLNTEIPETNVGFKLLQKMGWAKGKGLGRNEDGIVEPVRHGIDAGCRLGLGKQEEDNRWTNAELIERRRLESEIQANEDEDRKKRREAQAEREAKIKEEVAEIKKTFYCEVCNKQYNAAMELEEHLSSYDHHHKKRLAEMRAMNAERTREERARREAKAMDKEMARLQAQVKKAHDEKQKLQHGKHPQPAPPPVPPPQPGVPPSLPHSHTMSWHHEHPHTHPAAPPLPPGAPPPPFPPPPQEAAPPTSGHPPLPSSYGRNYPSAPYVASNQPPLPPVPPPPVPSSAPPDMPAPPPAPTIVPGMGTGLSISIKCGAARGGLASGRGMGAAKRGGAGRGGVQGGRGRVAGLAGFGDSSSDEEAGPGR